MVGDKGGGDCIFKVSAEAMLLEVIHKHQKQHLNFISDNNSILIRNTYHTCIVAYMHEWAMFGNLKD